MRTAVADGVPEDGVPDAPVSGDGALEALDQFVESGWSRLSIPPFPQAARAREKTSDPSVAAERPRDDPAVMEVRFRTSGPHPATGWEPAATAAPIGNPRGAAAARRGF